MNPKDLESINFYMFRIRRALEEYGDVFLSGFQDYSAMSDNVLNSLNVEIFIKPHRLL